MLVVDNGSGHEYSAFLGSVAYVPGVEVIRNVSNRGIAGALNQGVAWARNRRSRQVLTFDQDSCPATGFRVCMDATLRQAISVLGKQQVALLAPGVVTAVRYERMPLAGGRLAETVEVVQSGALFPLAVFDDIGLFDESLFIDCVDTEFCLRARRAGRHVLIDPAATLHHRLGASREIPFAGRRILVTGHSAERRYYMTRNRLLLIRRYGRHEPRWAFRALRRLLVNAVLAVVVESDRRRKACAICLGVVHGVLGRSGPLMPIPGVDGSDHEDT